MFCKGWGRLGLCSGHPKRKRRPGGQVPPRRQSESPAQTNLLNWWNLEQVSSQSPQRMAVKDATNFLSPRTAGDSCPGYKSPSSLNPERWDQGSSGTEETPESKRRWRSQEGTRCQWRQGKGSTQFTETMKSRNDHSQQTHTDTAQTRHRKGPEPGCSEKGCECCIVNTGLGLVGAGRGAGNTCSRLLLGKGLV